MTTCHNYEIHYKYRYECSQCYHAFGRHSNSINTSTQMCGRCAGRIVFVGTFRKDGSKVASVTGFARFTKDEFANTKLELARDLAYTPTHAAVMKKLSAKWKAQKSAC